MREGRGFTLIELLVVIGIIGVLFGLLFTGIARARFSGRLAGCRNNQKQIGQALHLYALENDGMLAGNLPFATNQLWSGEAGSPIGLGLLYPKYLGDARCLFCPTDQLNDPETEIAKMDPPQVQPARDAYCSYVFRQHSVGEGSWKLSDPGVNPEGRRIRALVLEVNVPAYGHIVHRGELVTVLFNDGSVRLLDNHHSTWTMTSSDPMAETIRIFTTADAVY